MNIRHQNLDSRLQLIPTKFWRLFTGVYLLASIVWYLTSATPIAAQSVTLSVSPPVVEILLAPGKKVEQTFTLQTSGENIEVTPELHLALPSDEEGHMTIDPSPITRQSLGVGGLTITISPPSTINHQPSTISVTLTLEAASTDVPQDVYLALVFRASPLESGVSRLTSTLPSISALILVTINPEGATPVDLKVEDFTLPQIHDSWLPLTIEPVLTNNSPVMIRPHGLYEIISPLGKTVFSVPLYPNLILGNSSRLLTSNVSNLSSNLTWIPKWSNLGPHRLRLTITTEGGTTLTQTEKLIWILPLRLLIITLTLIFCFLTFIYKMSKFKIV